MKTIAEIRNNQFLNCGAVVAANAGPEGISRVGPVRYGPPGEASPDAPSSVKIEDCVFIGTAEWPHGIQVDFSKRTLRVKHLTIISAPGALVVVPRDEPTRWQRMWFWIARKAAKWSRGTMP